MHPDMNIHDAMRRYFSLHFVIKLHVATGFIPAGHRASLAEILVFFSRAWPMAHEPDVACRSRLHPGLNYARGDKIRDCATRSKGDLRKSSGT